MELASATPLDGHNAADDGETHNENRREIQTQQHSKLINLLKQNTFCRSVSRVDTKNNTADFFTKHLDGLHTGALAKKLGLRFLDLAGGSNAGTADGGTNEEDR